jgi:hypothetical protein
MFIFLLRDGNYYCSFLGNTRSIAEGTVISIHPTPNLQFTEPVAERMQQHDSVLRTSEDPAILVEALLDLSWCSCLW